jgi:hypothetical protein
MPFCSPKNISVFRVGIKLGVTPSDIPKVDFATALNRISTHTRTPYRGARAWIENDFKDF